MAPAGTPACPAPPCAPSAAAPEPASSAVTGAGSFRKRLYVDEDFLTAVGGFDEAESAVVVPGFEGSGELHEGGGVTESNVRGHRHAAVSRAWVRMNEALAWHAVACPVDQGVRSHDKVRG